VSLPPEVRKTIQALNKKISALEETKRRLVETFGEPQVPKQEKSGGNKNGRIATPLNTEYPPVLLGSEGPLIPSSAEKLIDFLQRHGPATRKEIAERSGVPGGSISYLLKTDKFRLRDDQKWELS
jgi:hypothetical protein